MALLSCGYPIYHQFIQTSPMQPIPYTITVGGETFSFVVYSKSVTEPATINISDFARDYLDTFYEDMILGQSGSLPSRGLVSDFQTFTVSSDFNGISNNVRLIDLPIGTNLKDMVLNFGDMTKNPNPNNNESFIYLQNSTGGINVYGNFVRPSGQLGQLINMSLSGGANTILFDSDQGGWLGNTYTFTEDTHIYSKNNLYNSTSIYWGWDLITTVQNTSSGDATYTILYDYNTDGNNILPNTDEQSTIIYPYFDPRQFLVFGEYTTSPYNQTYSIGNATTSAYITKSGFFSIYTGNYSWTPHQKYTIYRNYGNNLGIITCTDCGVFQYCIYYVNKAGGYDWLLCKAEATWNREDNNATLYNQYNSIGNTKNTRIKSVIKKQYKLKSPVLNNQQSLLMDNLLNTPKAQLHNLATGEIIPVIITQASHERLQYPKDKNMQYSITVEQATQFERR